MRCGCSGSRKASWQQRRAPCRTESVLDHAIRDGLVDAAADRELRILRLGEPELIQELLRRKLITDAEMVPFLQRLTEARALEAFSEPVSFYRLSADTPPPEGRRAAVRPLSALAAEGVRRGLPAEEVDRLVPSMRGVPKMVRRVDPQALGLGDRERRLLEGIDGQRTVQQLLLATGVSRDPGRKALAVAVALGWLELQPPSQEEARAETVEVAAARLEARWAQVEDADYFTVLGLPRNAGPTRWPVPSPGCRRSTTRCAGRVIRTPGSRPGPSGCRRSSPRRRARCPTMCCAAPTRAHSGSDSIAPAGPGD
jgi:hypothetical protein